MSYSPECVKAFEALAKQFRWDTDRDESGYYIDWSMTSALAAFAANWERVRELELAIDQHDIDCQAACSLRKCGYEKYGRRCPDCPREWEIGKLEAE